MRAAAYMLMATLVQGESLPGILPVMPEEAEVESLPEITRQAAEGEGDSVVLMDELQHVQLHSMQGGEWVPLMEGVEASGQLVLPSPVTLAQRLRPFLGRPLTELSLGQMADEILLHYDREGFPVVMVSAPEQSLESGRLVLDVEVGKIGKVGVTRPKYGNPERVREGLRLRQGDWLERKDLERQLAWYGRTGFRRPRLFVSPGEEPATADLLIGLEERRPWQVSVGYENSGPDVLGQDRFVFGASGMLPNEHLLAWRGVIGLPASSLTANALRWEIPLHRSQQVIQIDAAYAEVASSYLYRGTPLESEGSSWTLAMMDRLRLPTVWGWEQQLAVGFELKGTDQFLLFGGATGAALSPGDVLMVDLKVDHRLEKSWDAGGLVVASGLRLSPGGLGGRNSDAAFQAYDPEAEASYAIANVDANGWWSPGADWRLAGRVAMQRASTHLLPAEQIGAGGYQTVRGVDERAYSMDHGVVGSLEIQSPLILAVPECRFRLLAFFDHAYLQDDGASSVSLSSVGLGVRARLFDHLDLRFDHGWRLDDDEHRSHVGITFSY